MICGCLLTALLRPRFAPYPTLCTRTRARTPGTWSEALAGHADNADWTHNQHESLLLWQTAGAPAVGPLAAIDQDRIVQHQWHTHLPLLANSLLSHTAFRFVVARTGDQCRRRPRSMKEVS